MINVTRKLDLRVKVNPKKNVLSKNKMLVGGTR